MLYIEEKTSLQFKINFSVANYCVFLLEKESYFSVDFVTYQTTKNTLLFLSPYQNFQYLGETDFTVSLLQFHADFYCIEYHKKEVACNGLLFNNIYLNPSIEVSVEIFQEIKLLLAKMQIENQSKQSYSIAVLKSYLQLVLALASKEKSKYLQVENNSNPLILKEVLMFQQLLEENFLKEKSVSFYATKLNLSTSSLSKKIKQQLNKTPTQLIQERVVLEAKKMLHLSHKSVKEIAFELQFEDAFYFSRYFKKAVGLSPLNYRKEVGISIVAK